MHHNQIGKEKISAKGFVKNAKNVTVFMLLFVNLIKRFSDPDITRNYSFRNLKTKNFSLDEENRKLSFFPSMQHKNNENGNL